MCAVFSGIHAELRRGASRAVADVVLEMTGRSERAVA